MRLFRVLPVLSLLLGARASFLDSRNPFPHRNDVRDLLDVCATVKTVLVVPNAPTTAGAIDACLCLSALPLFLKTNAAAIRAVDHAGEAAVTNTLTTLINDGAAKSNCRYPDHSTPACVRGNPCGFHCINGFTPSPYSNPPSCVCAPPSVNCNGQCVAAGACPSSHAVSKKRSWVVGSGSCTDMGPDWLACGVPGGGPRAWECIDTARDLESCGGCMFPLTAYSPFGKDCSSLPGVADVGCLSGECVLRRCLPGYALALDGNSCVRKHHRISQSQFIEDAEEQVVPARYYGLEHLPLGRN